VVVVVVVVVVMLPTYRVTVSPRHRVRWHVRVN